MNKLVESLVGEKTEIEPHLVSHVVPFAAYECWRDQSIGVCRRKSRRLIEELEQFPCPGVDPRPYILDLDHYGRDSWIAGGPGDYVCCVVEWATRDVVTE